MFYVYILASERNGTIYVGSTDDLRQRVEQHRDKRFGGFTARYGVGQLVWFESHPSRAKAFRRERQIKEWKRLWKTRLIEARNPNWRDLMPELDRWVMEDDLRELARDIPGFRAAPIPTLPPPPPPLIPAKAGIQAGLRARRDPPK